MAYLLISDVSKRFDGHPVLEAINLEVPKGQILSLLGASGCGKTTLLRIIAGLTTPDSGRVLLEGRDLAASPPHARRFGLMFQEFALFPHKNVFENVAFGLQMQQKDRGEIVHRTEEMLALVGLTGFEQRNVADLSGGERQRVALARSLAPQPRLLMLDEPLGALDRALRRRLMADLVQILRKVNVTTIFVTHDQAEAMAMADTICVMHAGRIEQTAAPEALYKHPDNIRVANFMGFENLIPGEVIEPGIVDTRFGPIASDTQGLSVGSKVTLLFRPDAVVSIRDFEAHHKAYIQIQGKIEDWLFMGHCYRLRLVTDQGPVLSFDLPNENPPPEPHTEFQLTLKRSAITIIKTD